ncbi:hypothetical protein OEZ86_008847 [Tetradesmus obliquus]|nr:hypothetical protein OEZ86_008847 [Tetradesmus obliquus]
MADPDTAQNAAVPLAFNQFIEVMNMDQAKDLVRAINTFMKDFKHRTPNAEADSQAVQGFLQQMETAMAKHPLFAASSPAELDAATEAMEKYLMTKLHERTFRAAPDDVERDELLAVRCTGLGFVQPQHLEVPDGIVDEGCLARAAAELNRMNNFKAPRDKLVCILNCCRMLNNLLTSRSTADGIGADDFTPLLILAVIRARPTCLASNLAYIERYRYHARLVSEAQYYYIQLCSAATFIEMMDATSLKVHPDEFIAHMLAAGAMSDEQLAMMQSSNSNSADGSAAAAAAGPGQPPPPQLQQPGQPQPG